MGELHLEIIVDKLKTDYNVEVSKGMPKVAYKEKLQKTISHKQVLNKQNGGKGKFADISFEVGPADDGVDGLQFVNEIIGGKIPKEFIPSIEKGFKNSMDNGLFGYPLQSMKIRLIDGSFHRVDSDAYSFEMVAQDAYREIIKLCDVCLLEPIMETNITTPDDYVGGVVSDISKRKGIVSEMNDRGNVKYILAKVPISKMFGYMTDLRTITSGRGDFNMLFSHYEKA